MKTQCNPLQLNLQGLDHRKIVVRNDSDVNTSDGGLLLLGQLEQRYHIIERLSECFTDKRDPARIQHSLKSLLEQRIFGIIQGYEDLNDHEQLRYDPLFQYVCESGKPLAGKSTLNRLELGKQPDILQGDRYSKITWDNDGIEDLFLDIFIEHFQKPPEHIILDFDATDIPLFGDQEMKFFHGYYDHYCYLPLYVFSGEYLLSARLKPANRDAAEGTEEILETLVKKIRRHFPESEIVFRGDSGFCREGILSLCESLGIKYVVGQARNNRLVERIRSSLALAKARYLITGKSQRIFSRFEYRTRESWSTSRSVVAKAEFLPRGENPRFIVTNIPEEQIPAQELYEDVYCARGNMENRIKDQKLDLFSSRTSSGWMSSNQLRFWFSGLAYTFFLLLKQFIPEKNPCKKNLPSTIRLKLLKISGSVRITVRRVWISLPISFPYWDIWRRIAVSI